MRCRQVEASDRVAFEVDLHEHSSRASDHACVVPRVDDNRLWSNERNGATVGILHLHLTFDEESDVCVHAQRGTHRWAEMGRPAVAGWVHDAFDTPVAGIDHIFVHATDVAMNRSFERRMTRI